MAHESFEDSETAKVLNKDFVCIKVDREERPDIDAVYMAACQAMAGSGGWPLTIVMNPDRKPFFAGTYFPKESMYGRMGLIELLEKIKILWKEDRQRLEDMGQRLTEVIGGEASSAGDSGESPAEGGSGKSPAASSKGKPDKELLHEACSQFSRSFDSWWGGFGAAPKFPAAHNIMFLMEYGQAEQSGHRSGVPEKGLTRPGAAERGENQPGAMEMAEKTLQAMARGGIFDHIGGGFSRYSTDEKWLVPHFEKMLYDNALLIMAYIRAYQLTNKKIYADVAERTADYVLNELTDTEGGFFCGQDADSDGVEGKYYVFTPEEIMSVLGEKGGKKFCKTYDITEKGNFEGKSIPNLVCRHNRKRCRNDVWQADRSKSRRDYVQDCWQMRDSSHEKLCEYRKSRTKLHLDDKILLTWNSWTIIAMVRAGRALGQERFLNAAVQAQKWISANMVDESDRLYLCFRDGEKAHAGQLEDYAVYGLALLELYGLTFEVKYLKEAIHRATQMVELFEDKENGGYFMNADDSEQLIARLKESYDGAMPSGNSAASMLLQQLADLTGESVWRQAAVRQQTFMAGQIESYPAGHCYGLLAMKEAIYPHKELICCGKCVTEELIDYLKSGKNQGVSVLFKCHDNADGLAECAPFTANYIVPEEGVMWYLCENGTCRAPASRFEELGLC